MRSKYCARRCDIDMFKAKPNSSNAWRVITENIDILCKGISIVVGNAVGTSFWHHRWAMKEPLSSYITREIPTHLLDAKVEIMWDKNCG